MPDEYNDAHTRIVRFTRVTDGIATAELQERTAPSRARARYPRSGQSTGLEGRAVVLLRDKRVWVGVVAAVILAFVSYSIVSNMGSGPTRNVADDGSPSPSVAASTSPLPSASDKKVVPPGSAQVPAVIGERLNQAKLNLTAVGLTNVHVEDVTGQGRPVLEDNNWIVETQSPEPDLVVDTHTQMTLKVRKPTDSHSPQETAFGVVPNVVCANLQDAQDALNHSGFVFITEHDATGQKRTPVLDRNWVVTEQNVPPGSQPGPTTHIVLTVVKYGEPTNNPDCES
jgi:beta-lactam-binding protein with PASTA domain